MSAERICDRPCQSSSLIIPPSSFIASCVMWPKWESNPQSHEALDLAALPVCVPGHKLQVRESHPTC